MSSCSRDRIRAHFRPEEGAAIFVSPLGHEDLRREYDGHATAARDGFPPVTEWVLSATVTAVGDGGRAVTATIHHYHGRPQDSLQVVTLGLEWVTSAQPWRNGAQTQPTTAWKAGPLNVARHVTRQRRQKVEAAQRQAEVARASPNCGSVGVLAAEIVELRRKNAPGPAHTEDGRPGWEKVPGLLPRVESYEAQLAGAIEVSHPRTTFTPNRSRLILALFRPQHVLGRYDASAADSAPYIVLAIDAAMCNGLDRIVPAAHSLGAGGLAGCTDLFAAAKLMATASTLPRENETAGTYASEGWAVRWTAPRHEHFAKNHSRVQMTTNVANVRQVLRQCGDFGSIELYRAALKRLAGTPAKGGVLGIAGFTGRACSDPTTLSLSPYLSL